jgi:MFS family permease
MPVRRPRAVPAVLGVPGFRALWLAELLSVAGDQLARVALAVLVFGRTGSASWSALTYALTFLPALLGGVLLGGLADRFPRRRVLVAADLARAGLVAVMAVPGLPLWVLCALLVATVLLAAPHTAAQGALLPQLLPGELYERGLAVRQITAQSAQLVGFAAGGVLVGALDPAVALLADALTFALSALVGPTAPGGCAGCPAWSGRSPPTRSGGRWSGWPGWSGATWCRRGWPRRTRPRSGPAARPWGCCWRPTRWAVRWARTCSSGSSPSGRACG